MTPQQLRDSSSRGLSLGAAVPVRLGERTESASYQGKPATEMQAEHREWLDAQPLATSCAFCEWTFEGTTAECREAARAHREQEHPAATNRLGRHRRKSKPKHQRTDAEKEQASREATEARRVRAEREDAARVAQIERGRQRDALANAGGPQGREEEQRAHTHAESPAPHPADSPPPRDESGLEETPAAEGAAGTRGVADVSSSPITHDEETTTMQQETTNGRAKKWPRERVIAAIQEVAAEVGGTPTIGQMGERGYTFAVSCSKLGLGTWSELVVAAGFAPNKSGGATRSGREPLAAGHAVTPAEEDAALRGRSTEPASRPEHPEPVALEVLDLVKFHDDLADGTLTVTRWTDGQGDQDETAELALRQIVANAIADFTPDEIGRAVLARLRLAA